MTPKRLEIFQKDKVTRGLIWLGALDEIWPFSWLDNVDILLSFGERKLCGRRKGREKWETCTPWTSMESSVIAAVRVPSLVSRSVVVSFHLFVYRESARKQQKNHKRSFLTFFSLIGFKVFEFIVFYFWVFNIDWTYVNVETRKVKN